jgi:serine protease SohB
LAEYGIFLLKAITILAVILIIIGFAAAAGSKQKKQSKGHIEINKLNDRFKDYRDLIRNTILGKDEQKKLQKQEKKQQKLQKKGSGEVARRRVYVLGFKGDVQASAVESLREEITAVLAVADDKDEVIVRVESPGGVVHGYGLAASQLTRIKEKGIDLTVCVDSVAASGGYMMACVGDKILSAPFAIIGSIGVIGQVPNFNRLLKKHDIEFEQHTAGDYKRTLTVFGENTDEGREKFKSDLENIHKLFKDFIKKHRSSVDLDEVANGDVWYGQDAIDKKLVDRICTSDQYLMDLSANADIFEVKYVIKKGWQAKLAKGVSQGIERGLAQLSDLKNWQR